MRQRLLIQFILFSAVQYFVYTDILQICTTSTMSVQKGSFAEFESFKTVQDVRSVVECATLCHAEVECQSAVYKRDKTCHLIVSTSDITAVFTNNRLNDDYLLRPAESSCPSTCDGDSVCVLVCSDTASPEDVCVAGLSETQDGCNISPVKQLKEYYLSGLDEASSEDNHVYFTVTFTKLYESTTLRVKFRGTLRGGFGALYSSGVWEIKFNGTSCGSPGKIASAHSNYETNVSHHRASGIHGICQSLSLGPLVISLTAALDRSTLQVGYLTEASRLFIEEFEPAEESTVSACSSLSSFNIDEKIIDVTSDDYGDSEPLWNTTYLKMENDTSLKINMNLVIRISTTSVSCAMWTILIDGNECQPVPFWKLLAYFYGGNRVSSEYRSAEVEGYCDGIAAGLLEISLYARQCNGSSEDPTNLYTGWDGTCQRMIIEEYRPKSNINSVMAADGKTVYRLPQMNAVTFGVFGLDSDIDEGIVWNLGNYHKLYASTGLRLSMSSDARAMAASHACCRFYFMINRAECDTPGPIEGIISINLHTNIHRPILVEGVCEGISAGDVELSVHVGNCRGRQEVSDCSYGYNSYSSVMATEVYMEREIIDFQHFAL